MSRLRLSSVMSSLPHGLPYTSAEFVDVCAGVNRSSFLSVPPPQLLLSLALSMAPQHKQKVHKTGFAAVPKAVPSQQSQALLGSRTCRICSRVYSTVNALEQHYRDTPVHPKCTRCDIGFADNAAIQAHVISTHRPITCNVCNGLQVYGEDVARHYKISPNHPSCTICDIGFENKEAFDEVRQTPHLVAYGSCGLKLVSHPARRDAAQQYEAPPVQMQNLQYSPWFGCPIGCPLPRVAETPSLSGVPVVL
ncbi:hypothetical protein EDB92DRAFT_2026515 [Lactarius akahatsu]|uniref:C2H2-type domain-containing protein n=1 Tax=Lactarius akahatsu TaxID=416441 RepID=A0AAD4LN56_9AGAM|nr:hypothetical protein EDB92DRAFT_2026515 [Lactarius akahatsu]